MTTKFQTIEQKLAQKRRYRMQSGVIVFRKAETFIPNEYLELVLKENPHGWGAVTISTDENGKKFLEINSGDEAASLEDLQEVMKVFPKQDITFYFCSSEGGVSSKDISPYVILTKPADDDPDMEVPTVVACVEGNFPNYAKADSSHPPEYHVVEDYLIPKIRGIYKSLDDDLEDTIEFLEGNAFKKGIMLTQVSRGVFTIIAETGKMLTFSQNELGGEFPWGWTSKTYGYGKAEPEKVVDKVKKGIFGNRSTVREPFKAPIAEAVAAPKTETAVHVPAKYFAKLEAPNTGLSRSERETWYKVRMGHYPQEGKKGIPIAVVYSKADGKLITHSMMTKMGLEAAPLWELVKNNPKRGKNTEPSYLDTNNTLPTTQDKPVVGEILPIMSPKGKEQIAAIRSKENYKKLIAENASVITDPKQYESYETRFADFAKQVKVDSMEEFATGWDFGMRYDFCKSNPLEAAVMMNTFANLLIKNEVFGRKPEPVEPEVEEEEEVKPRKKGIFSRAS